MQNPFQPGRDPSPAYEVACGCGQVVRGARQGRRQVVRCPACGRPVFVLARSPLGPVGASAPPAPTPWLVNWRAPLVAGAVTLTVLIILFSVLLPLLVRRSPPAAPHGGSAAPPPPHLDAGRRALAEGEFHLALQELDDARPEASSPAARRELDQLNRQADLLARLSSRSLEEIVGEAELVRHEHEWKARFDSDYKGKSVVFDDVVRFDDAKGDARRPVLTTYRVTVGGRDARLALEDLTLLQTQAREKPQRMLFGGRLSAVERGSGGKWVVHFEPDSGVLLTDRGAAEAVCPAPFDPALDDVLRRQEEWLRLSAAE